MSKHRRARRPAWWRRVPCTSYVVCDAASRRPPCDGQGSSDGAGSPRSGLPPYALPPPQSSCPRAGSERPALRVSGCCVLAATAGRRFVRVALPLPERTGIATARPASIPATISWSATTRSISKGCAWAWATNPVAPGRYCSGMNGTAQEARIPAATIPTPRGRKQVPADAPTR